MTRLLEHVPLDLNGPTLLHEDMKRLARQRTAVLAWMAGGAWWTLAEIAEHTGFPEASVSARLRDFRKARYGGHAVNRRRRNGESRGTWEYAIVMNNG